MSRYDLGELRAQCEAARFVTLPNVVGMVMVPGNELLELIRDFEQLSEAHHALTVERDRLARFRADALRIVVEGSES